VKPTALETIRGYVADGIPQFDDAFNAALNEREAMVAALQEICATCVDRIDGDSKFDVCLSDIIRIAERGLSKAGEVVNG
jgi:hypothetical protein